MKKSSRIHFFFSSVFSSLTSFPFTTYPLISNLSSISFKCQTASDSILLSHCSVIARLDFYKARFSKASIPARPRHVTRTGREKREKEKWKGRERERKDIAYSGAWWCRVLEGARFYVRSSADAGRHQEFPCVREGALAKSHGGVRRLARTRSRGGQ